MCCIFYFLAQMKTECVLVCASSCIMHVCLQEILSDQQNDGAYALHHTSHGQSSLSETSTQPSLSVPSFQPPLPEPSTRSALPEPSTQQPLTLFSQPQEILTLYDEPPLSPLSAQEPIIILDEQDESVSQNQSPVSTHHLGGPVDECVFLINLILYFSSVCRCFIFYILLHLIKWLK